MKTHILNWLNSNEFEIINNNFEYFGAEKGHYRLWYTFNSGELSVHECDDDLFSGFVTTKEEFDTIIKCLRIGNGV